MMPHDSFGGGGREIQGWKAEFKAISGPIKDVLAELAFPNVQATGSEGFTSDV